MEFILNDANEPGFRALDAFTQGYITALFFTDEAPGVSIMEWNDAEEAGEGHAEGSFPEECGFTDLAPESLAAIMADCAAFQTEAGELLALAYEQRSYGADSAGHDFWLTRNGHGSGFWDRDDLKVEVGETGYRIGESLAAICGHGTTFSTVDACYGDDGLIYLS